MLDHSTVYLAGGDDIIIIVVAVLVFLGKILFKGISSSDDTDKEIDEAEAKHKEEMRRQIREKMEAARRENQDQPVSPTVIREFFDEPPRMQEPVVIKAPDPVREVQYSEPAVEGDPMLDIQRRIEALKEQGLEAQHKVDTIQSQKSVPPVKKGLKARAKTVSLRASLKQSLSDSRSAQQAILLGEVLGKPKGLQ